MSCFDAQALTQDAEGLAFLKTVLDIPAGASPLPGAFDPNQDRPSWTIYPQAPESQSLAAASVAETV